MADPLSISASITALLQLTSSIVKYINDAQDASKEQIRLRDDISSASWSLYMLKERLGEANGELVSHHSITLLGGPDGPVTKFRQLLEDLSAKLTPKTGKSHRLAKAGKALAWPFQKEEVKDLLSAVERQKSLFHLALQNDSLYSPLREKAASRQTLSLMFVTDR